MGNQHATSRLPRPALLPSAARAPRLCQLRALIDQHDRTVAVAPRTSYQGPQRAASTRCSICSVTTSRPGKSAKYRQPASQSSPPSLLPFLAVFICCYRVPEKPPRPSSKRPDFLHLRQATLSSTSHPFVDLTSSTTCNPSHPSAPRQQPLDRCNLLRPCCDRLPDRHLLQSHSLVTRLISQS